MHTRRCSSRPVASCPGAARDSGALRLRIGAVNERWSRSSTSRAARRAWRSGPRDLDPATAEAGFGRAKDRPGALGRRWCASDARGHELIAEQWRKVVGLRVTADPFGLRGT